MNSLSVAIVADTHTKQLYMVDLRKTNEEFYNEICAEAAKRNRVILSAIFREVLKEKYNLDAEVYPGDMLGQVWFTQKSYEWYMLRYGQ